MLERGDTRKRKRKCSRKCWMADVKRDVEKLGITEWKEIVKDLLNQNIFKNFRNIYTTLKSEILK